MYTIMFAFISIVLAIILFQMFSNQDINAEKNQIKINELDQEIQDWYHQGKMVNILDREMFIIEKGKENIETVILIHGFPTSSFDYRKAFDTLLQKNFRVVSFDHVGFGFSEKPASNYSYSLVEQAEQALQLWKYLGIESAHIVAHDMGDSITTEILSRYERGILPDYFNKFFKSVTFTNGGMRYDLINFRLSQSLLLSPLGKMMSGIATNPKLQGLFEYFGQKQLTTIWSPSYTDDAERIRDIKHMQDLNRYRDGNSITYLTISYLRDRQRFESRWLRSLKNLDFPILLLWGDSDAVSPVAIPKSLADHLQHKNVQYRTLPGVGHFLMLEQPQAWAQNILDFIS